MEYPAHIRFDDKGEKIVQTVREHCESVAKYAGDSLAGIKLSHAAYLAGLLHDMGKAQIVFSDYIEKAAYGSNVKRGEVIHTFQGCRYILETNHKKGMPLSQDALADEIIAYAVGAHHGLFDCIGGGTKEHGFLHRMNEEVTGYEEAKKYFFDLNQEETFEDLLQSARSELKEVIEIVSKMTMKGLENYRRLSNGSEEHQKKIAQDLHFYVGLITRLILSSVIEGDRRDTANFMNGTEYPMFGTYNQDRSLFWERQLHAMEDKLRRFPADTPIQKARAEISDICRDIADGRKGVYRLNVPTGGGKTLASLRYALAHAAKHGMNRIIFTAPLLSIIDQNALVIRSFLEDDSIVLEHHSNLGDELIDHLKSKKVNGVDSTKVYREALDGHELLTESWDAPIIITSMVQLLQTFFSGRTACIRRFQALCNSVIVIDEVQTVPGNMLSLFDLTVNFLSEICGVTFVLCSATQPYFEGAEHPLLRAPIELVPFSERLWGPFQRTEIIEVPGIKLEEIPGFVLQESQKTHSLLVICNKKSEAEYLFKNIEESCDRCFHLSAAMCMAHRKKVLKEIMEAIKSSKENSENVVCITTQVIEAGVDISFGRVIRFAAGMDSIVQAAGRCNRNGEEIKRAPVYIVNCVDEKLGKLKEINDGKKALQDLLITYAANPKLFENDLSSEQAIRYYYKSLYGGMQGGHQDFSVKSPGQSLLSMLSTNTGYQEGESKEGITFVLNQAFAEAGKRFSVFNNNTTDVVIPYGEGERLIRKLEEEHDRGFVSAAFMSEWLRCVKPYTVSMYDYQKDAIEKQSGISEVEGVLILRSEFYDDKTGIVTNISENGIFLEV